jgi:multiple sugar transport system substrate-binding protein
VFAGSFSAQTLELLDTLVADYEAANPDTRVELNSAPGSWTERRSWIGDRLRDGNSSVDIFQLDVTWTAQMAASGELPPLGEALTGSMIDWDRLPRSLVEASTFDGQLYAVPWLVDLGLLYYRTDLFHDDDLLTASGWPEIQDAALEAWMVGDTRHGFVWPGQAGEDLTCMTLEFVWAAGGQVLDAQGRVAFDSPETRRALDQMVGFIESGTSPPSVTELSPWTTLTVFRSGESMLARSWSYGWTVLNAPGVPVAGQVSMAVPPASCLGGESLVVSPHTIHPEKAQHFVAHLLALEQQRQLAIEAHHPPARTELYGEPDLGSQQPAMEVWRQALSRARPRPVSARYGKMSEIIYSEVHALLLGAQDVDTTSATIQDRLEELLAQ